MEKGIRITVDGPAGAGKSTAAKSIAKRLGYLYIDTGAMYRALTLKALRRRVDLADEEALGRLAAASLIRLTKPDLPDGLYRVVLDGEDVTEAIRAPEVNAAVSDVAKVPAVRRRLVEQQRAMAEHGGVVMDGRDAGTNVLPDAEVKFYLTASLEERVRRRFEELRRKGFEVSLPSVRQDIARRDEIDSGRAVAPLRKALGAVEVDSSELTIDQMVESMLCACGRAVASGAGSPGES
ncbi:MAG TPA: (d)CMP kinase [Bacillota bacterium]|jgi:cytidylate kinase